MRQMLHHAPQLLRGLKSTVLLLLVLALAASTGCHGQAAPPPAAAASTPRTNFTMCGFNVWYGALPWIMASRSAYAQHFPGITFNFRVLNSGDDLRGVVQTYLADGAGCDIVTNTAYSPYALALSPLMSESAAWVDGSCTSTDLSDKIANPYFSRVIPTDSVGAGGAAAFVANQGWTLASVICVDESYGRSVADGFSRRFNRVGGTVEVSRCLPPSFTADEFKATIEGVLATAESSVVFLAGAFGQPAIDAIRSSSAASRAAIILCESMCTSSWMTQIPGAFCGTYGIDDTAATAMQTAYNTRDVAAEVAQYGAVLDYAAGDLTYEIDFWAAMVVDAARAAMHGVVGYETANRTEYPTVSEYLRTVTFRGITGHVSFDANGDRVESVLHFFNSQPSATNRSEVDLIKIGALDNATVALSSSTLYYAVDGGKFASSPPSMRRVESSASESFPAWGIVVIVAVLLLIVMGAAAAKVSHKPGRDNAAAPKDPNAPFTIMFTDIQSSTTQWATNPEDMGPAVDQHHDIIRRVLPTHKGYEVKTIGDSFMVAFVSAEDALACAVSIQEALFAAQWPSSLEKVYQLSDDKPLPESQYRELWAGLRVRIGVHTGSGSIKLDPVTQGYDYYGTVVNTAARVEGVGHGGQILITAATKAALFASPRGRQLLESQVKLTELGPQPLRGLAAPVELIQLLPNEFAGRQFGPLRLDIEVAVEDDADTADDAHIVIGHAGGESGSSRSHSSVSSKFARSSPEAICASAARRLNLSAKDILHHFEVLKAVYSPFTTKDRAKVVAEVAKKWRVPVDAKTLQKPNDHATEALMAQMAVRATSVVAAWGGGDGGRGHLAPTHATHGGSATATPRVTDQGPTAAEV